MIRQLYKLIPSSIFLLFVVCACIKAPIGEQQFSHLANGFLHGQLSLVGDLTNSPSDLVFFNNQTFWPLGPLPAVLLMPFVAAASWLDLSINQAYVQCLLVLAVFGLIYLIAHRLKYRLYDALVLAFGFVLGSSFIGVAGSAWSWYFAQVVAVGLAFAALLEFMRGRRWWLIGCLCGLLLMTRLTAGLLIVFFVWENWLAAKQHRLRRLVSLVTPFLAAGLLLAAYNYLRLGNPFEQGYRFQEVPDFYARVRDMGLFSLAHLPTNFYHMFLAGPLSVQPANSYSLVFPYVVNNPWGMSVFVTSPYFLYLFTVRRRELQPAMRRLMIVGGIIMLAVLCWFSTGWWQFGYRLSLDFLPLFFVVFMAAYRQRHSQLSGRMQLLLLGTGLTNLYMLLSYLGLVRTGP